MNTGHALRVRHVCRNVSNLPRAVAFYCQALQFSVEETFLPGSRGGARTALLRLGQQTLKLMSFDIHGFPYPSRHGAADPWFQHLAIVVADMAAAYAQLRQHAFEPISRDGPQHLPPNTGAVTAFKFRDPDGHPLELIQFPPGTGDPRWQRGRGLFLGIDHTAVVVTDARASLAFYGALGFHVTARSHNRGAEQERLDGIAQVDLDVIGLAPPESEPPRLELLCYHPSAGRASEIAPDDTAVDQTVVEVDRLSGVLDALQVPYQRQKGTALVTDPDGHRILLCERTRLA